MNAMTGQLGVALGYAVRVAVALILLSAALGKLRAPAQFRLAVLDYRLLPSPLGVALATLLPPCEIALAGWLLVKPAGFIAAILAAAIFVAFAGAIAINLQRGRGHIDCGCSAAPGGQAIHGAMVVRNLVLAAALVGASLAPFPADLVLCATAAWAGAILFLLHVTYDRLVAHAARWPAFH